MPPILALSLTSIFILFLLHLERKQNPAASYALWVPTIWFLLATSKPLSVWFGIEGGSFEEGSAIDRNVLISLFCLGLLIIKKRNVKIIGVLQQNLPVILMMGIMFISISWSDIPFISFKRFFKNFIPIVMALIIASESDARQALLSLFRRMIYIHIPFSLILIKYYSYLGREYHRWSGEVMWIGVSSQKNGLAFLCMFSLFYFSWTFIRRWKGRDKPTVWYQTYIEIAIILLSIHLFMGPNQTLTYSATAFVVLILGLIFLIGLLWLKKHNIILSANFLTILITTIIIYGTITPFIGRLALFDPSAALKREETLTGRFTIWAFLVPHAMQKPILGHGYGGFWTDVMRESTPEYPAHNGYLETILDTGFTGLLFLSMFLISNCRKAQHLMTRDFDWGVLWFCILLMAVTRSISESAVMSFIESMPAVLLFILISHSLNISKLDEAIKKQEI